MTTTTAPPSKLTSDLRPGRPVRRRRASRLMLLAVVLGVLGGLSGALLYHLSGNRVGIVAMARAVPIGQVLTRDDVREVPLPAGTELATVEWRAVATVVGQVATTDLLVGQVVSPDSVTTSRGPQVGDAVVGISVGPGRVPLTALSVRDEVLVIGLDEPSAPRRATVLRVGEPDGSGKRVVDLVVAEGVAVDLARASAEDRAALVLVARR